MIRNRIAYIAVVLMLGLFVYLYESEMTYAALYAVLILPVASFLLAAISRRRFGFKEHLSEVNIVKGESVKYIFRIKNNSFLPCVNVRVRFKANSSAIETDFRDRYFFMGPFKEFESEFTINAKYRGLYEVGVENIVLYDFLGLFKFEQKHTEALELIVRPRVLHMKDMPLVAASQGLDTVKNYTLEEDYAVISDLRKYQPTDGHKKIHWKASVKRNELISKNYQALKKNTAVLIVDNSISAQGSDAIVAEDALMEAVVSVLAHCNRLQYLTTMHFIGSEEKITGSFDYMFTVACRMKFTDSSNFDDFLTNFQKMQADTENVVIFSHCVTGSVFACVQSLLVFGNNVILYYFKKPSDSEAVRISQLMDLGINCINFPEYAKTLANN